MMVMMTMILMVLLLLMMVMLTTGNGPSQVVTEALGRVRSSPWLHHDDDDDDDDDNDDDVDDDDDPHDEDDDDDDDYDDETSTLMGILTTAMPQVLTEALGRVRSSPWRLVPLTTWLFFIWWVTIAADNSHRMSWCCIENCA
jgi:hypothetical protein